MRSKTIH